MSQVTGEQLEDIEALFVQTSASMTSDGGTIILHGLSPSTLYFADRPQREVGHMPSRLFVELWGEGDNSFAANPPNAVLSFAEPGDRPPEDAVVVIQDPRLDGDQLRYTIKLLEGTVPSATGSCALFIDPFGRPLSPISAAGMHRRALPPRLLNSHDCGSARSARSSRTKVRAERQRRRLSWRTRSCSEKSCPCPVCWCVPPTTAFPPVGGTHRRTRQAWGGIPSARRMRMSPDWSACCCSTVVVAKRAPDIGYSLVHTSGVARARRHVPRPTWNQLRG